MMIASFLPHHMEFTLMLSNLAYNASKLWKFSLILPSLDFAEILLLHSATTLSMNTTDYWLMAREYSIWNAAIASLQFWTEDLDPVTLGRATETCLHHIFSTYLIHSTSSLMKYYLDVSNYILHSRNIFLEIGQAFPHCCELPQD